MPDDTASDVVAPTTRPRWLLVTTALLVAALFFAAVAALLDVDEDRTEIHWAPTAADVGVGSELATRTVLLARHRPERMDVDLSTDCSSLRNLGAGQVLFSTAAGRAPTGRGSGLTVRTDTEAVEVLRGDAPVLRVPLADEGECAVGLHLRDPDLALDVGTSNASTILPAPPIVSQLRVPASFIESGARVQVDLVTFSAGTTPRPLNLVLSALAALLIVAAIVGFLKARPRDRLAGRSSRPATAIVLAGLTVWLPVAPFLFDDGWVRQSSLHLRAFANVYDNYGTWDVRLPIGWIQYLFYGPWLGVSDFLVWQRLPAFAAVIAGWFLVRRVAVRELGLRWVSTVFLAVLYVSLSAAWLVTLRPEPLVSLCAVAALALGCTALRTDSLRMGLLTVAVGALGPAIHTTGGVAVVPGVAVILVWAWSRWRLRERLTAVWSVVLAAILGAAILAVLTFTPRNLADWQANGDLFRSSIGQTSWRDEILRYSRLFDGAQWDTVLRRGTVFVLVLGALGVLVIRRRLTSMERFVFASLLGSLLFLLITPTKWPWHFGSIVAIAVIAAGLTFDRLEQRAVEEGRALRFDAMFLIGATLASGLVVWRSFDSLDLAFRFWLKPEWGWDVRAALTSFPVLFLVAAAILGAAALPFLRRHRPALVAGVLLTALPFIVSVGALWFLDFHQIPGWTIGRQSFAPISGNYRCGLAGAMHLPNPTQRYPLSSSRATVDRAGDASTIVRLGRTLRVRTVTPLEPFEIDAALPDQPSYVIAFARGSATTHSVVVLELSNNGDDISLTPVSQGLITPDGYTPVLFELPEGQKTDAQLQVFAPIPTDAPVNELELSEPLGFGRSTLERLTAREQITTTVSPEQAMAFPCTEASFFSKGIVELPSFVIGVLPLLPTSSVGIATDTEDYVTAISSSSQLPIAYTWFLDVEP